MNHCKYKDGLGFRQSWSNDANIKCDDAIGCHAVIMFSKPVDITPTDLQCVDYISTTYILTSFDNRELPHCLVFKQPNELSVSILCCSNVIWSIKSAISQHIIKSAFNLDWPKYHLFSYFYCTAYHNLQMHCTNKQTNENTPRSTDIE